MYNGSHPNNSVFTASSIKDALQSNHEDIYCFLKNTYTHTKQLYKAQFGYLSIYIIIVFSSKEIELKLVVYGQMCLCVCDNLVITLQYFKCSFSKKTLSCLCIFSIPILVFYFWFLSPLGALCHPAFFSVCFPPLVRWLAIQSVEPDALSIAGYWWLLHPRGCLGCWQTLLIRLTSSSVAHVVG